MCLGVLLIIAGLVALRYTEDKFNIYRPPYFLGAFIVGILVSFVIQDTSMNIQTTVHFLEGFEAQSLASSAI